MENKKETEIAEISEEVKQEALDTFLKSFKRFGMVPGQKKFRNKMRHLTPKKSKRK